MFRLCICILLFIPLWAVGQAMPEHCKWIRPLANNQQADEILLEGLPLDSLSVLPASIRVNRKDSVAEISYDLNTGIIRFAEGPWADSVLVCYQILPFALHQPYFKRTLSIYDSTALFEYPARDQKQSQYKEELFATDSLQKSGSISRGISFGNRQNIFVQSTLNLQLEGKLSENVNIRAAISDQDVPFQPEGNTQKLQEFDKVYIQLYNKANMLTAGDLVLQQKDGYFLKYLKNVQGISFITQYPFLAKGISETEAGLALAKGKFASVNIEPVDGLSGPYKLPGPGKQLFVMVLSNSERVFLDGKLLKRGFNYDYIIDYNLGEIIFTPGIIITRYSRIRVDYEYSDQNFSRGIISASHRQKLGGFEFYSQFFQEKDNRNQPLAVDLNNQQKEMLSQAGDRPEGIYVDAVDSLGYNEDLLLYRKVEHISSSGERMHYYEFSNQPEEAFYQLSFADLGEGRGNYLLKEFIGKGKVYEFIAPVNGQLQGRFEPVRLLTPATMQNMLASGLSYQLGPYQRVSSEIAVSKNDQNLFSDLGQEDDKGIGVKSNYQLKGLPAFFDAGYKWEAGMDYELVQAAFSPVDRFRSVEFDRDWGISPKPGFTYQEQNPVIYNDHILTMNAGLKKNQLNYLNYRIARRRKGGLVNGWQQEGQLAKKIGVLQLNGQHFLLKNEQDYQNVNWLRWQGTVALHFPKWVPGYRYTADRQAMRSRVNDSLLNTLMNFREHSVFLQNGANAKSNIRLEYSNREDKVPEEGVFIRANLAHTTSLSYVNEQLKNQKIRSLISYRHSRHFHDTTGLSPVEQVLSGQVNWLGNFFKNGLRSEIIYTVGSGRELRRDYVYVRVPAGQGTHTWRDGNENGIQELGEFYEAINTDEKEFLRIFVPDADFILAYTSELNYRLSFREAKRWYDKKGLRQVLSRFSGNASWKVNKKSTDAGILQRFVPFSANVEDSELLNTRNSLQLSLFYKKSDPHWGLDGAITAQQRKQLLSAGFETDQRQHYELGYRYNFNRHLGFRISSQTGRDANFSEFLQEQQFNITCREIASEISWMPGMDFQLRTVASMEEKENVLNTEIAKKARLSNLDLNVRYSRQSNTAVTATISNVHIKFQGQENSAAAYNMLEALRPGTNWIWNVNFQQNLLKGLQLSLTYEGRQSEGQPMVNIGRMMVQALF